jgi:hypothetical protein
MRVVAALLALVAVICLTVSIVGMVTGRPGERVGWLLRTLAVVAFGAAVAVNVAAH